MSMKVFCLTAVLAVVLVPSANAGVLGGFLTNGVNTLEDGSRELFINVSDAVAGVTSIDAGDILIGFSKVENITPLNNYTDNSVYAVFSQTFANISGDLLAGPSLLRTFDFVPTTAAGFTLADLVGAPVVGASAMVAVLSSNALSGYSIDFSLDSLVEADMIPGITIGDAFAAIRNEGTLHMAFGIAPRSTDYFAGRTGLTITDAQDFITNLALAPPQPTNLVNFEAGLSLVYDNLLDDVVVESGGMVVGGTARLPGTGENVDNAFTFVNDADLQFRSRTVPEPSTIISLVAVAVCGLGARLRRRKV